MRLAQRGGVKALIAFLQGGLGDQFAALAAVQHAYRKYAEPGERLCLADAMPGVETLFPERYNVGRVWQLPGSSMHRVISICAGIYMPSLLYNSQLAFVAIGEPPPAFPYPKLAVWGNSRMARYDYLVHPWSADPTRHGSLEETRRIIDALRIVTPDASIALLGVHGEPTPWPDVAYEYSRPFLEVIAMMRHAKAVVTIDSSMNRLAACAQIPHHVLLAGPPCPVQSISWPGAHLIYGRDRWSIENIVASVEPLAQKKA